MIEFVGQRLKIGNMKDRSELWNVTVKNWLEAQ